MSLWGRLLGRSLGDALVRSGERDRQRDRLGGGSRKRTDSEDQLMLFINVIHVSSKKLYFWHCGASYPSYLCCIRGTGKLNLGSMAWFYEHPYCTSSNILLFIFF